MDRNLYYLWMRVDNKVTNAKIVKLLEYFGAPEEIYKADANALKSCKFLAEREIKALLDKDLGVAESEADMCELCHVGLLSIDDADYPEMLRNIPEYPVLLYTMGDTSLLNTLCVTMVGRPKGHALRAFGGYDHFPGACRGGVYHRKRLCGWGRFGLPQGRVERGRQNRCGAWGGN